MAKYENEQIEHLAKRFKSAGVDRRTFMKVASAMTAGTAVVAGIPLATVGAAAYFTVFSLAILALFGYRIAGTLLTPIVIAMFFVSLWLIYLQAFVIREFCQYCLLSALITLGLSVVVLINYRLRRLNG